MKVSGLPKSILENLYTIDKKSVSQISVLLKCSENKINYWLSKYKIKKRTISDAIYQLKNPLGDPFALKQPKNLKEGILFGMGLGLYWGEGTKRGNGGMRITNTDARMLQKFIKFLESFFGIDKNKLRFSIQIHHDIEIEAALNYWSRELGVKKSQFYKTLVLKSRGEGTYKYKSQYGVVIVQFNNTRLKKIICNMIENFS